MNRTIKDATVKRYHYDSHEQLRGHLADFLDAYNFAGRLRKAGKPHKVIITAVARKLVIIANALCKNRQK